MLQFVDKRSCQYISHIVSIDYHENSRQNVTTLPVLSLKCCCSNFLFTFMALLPAHDLHLVGVGEAGDYKCPIATQKKISWCDY